MRFCCPNFVLYHCPNGEISGVYTFRPTTQRVACGASGINWQIFVCEVQKIMWGCSIANRTQVIPSYCCSIFITCHWFLDFNFARYSYAWIKISVDDFHEINVSNEKWSSKLYNNIWLNLTSTHYFKVLYRNWSYRFVTLGNFKIKEREFCQYGKPIEIRTSVLSAPPLRFLQVRAISQTLWTLLWIPRSAITNK